MYFRRLLILLVYPVFLSIHCSAQDDSTGVDLQTWIDFTTIHHFNSKWVYSGDYGLRGVISGESWTTLYVRPTFRYRIKPVLDVRAGVALFVTNDEEFNDLIELRFHQEADLKWPEVAGIIFRNKLRLEERFFFYRELENDFSARLRYKLSIESPDFHLFNIKGPFFAETSFELFFDLGETATEKYVNRNRFEFGLGYRASNKFRCELHYTWQNSKDNSEDTFKTSVNILRFRLYLMTFKKDKTKKDNN